MSENIAAVIVAAGKGERMQASIPKAFLKLCGRPLFTYSLATFMQVKAVSKYVVVVPENKIKNTRDICSKFFGDKQTKRINIVKGGDCRQVSVENALKALSSDTAWVLIHDAARPLVDNKLIKRVIDNTKQYGAAVPGIKAVDTLKKINLRENLGSTVNRDSILYVQTPQGFRLTTLRKAYMQARQKSLFATDDASLIQALGKPVKVVLGSPLNFKVTFPEDKILTTAILNYKRKKNVENRSRL